MRTLRTPKFQQGAQNKARNDSNEGASENPETPQELGRVQVEGPHKVHISRRGLLVCWKMIFWQSLQGPGRGPIMCERFRWRIHKCPGNRKGVVHFDEDQDSCLGQRSALLRTYESKQHSYIAWKGYRMSCRSCAEACQAVHSCSAQTKRIR